MTQAHDSIFLTTADGSRFRVRSARAEDDGTIKDFFSHVSRTDLRFRFLSGINEVSPAQIAMLAHPDRAQSESYLAFTADGSMMIASGMLAGDDAGEHGEVAIAIREDHKHKGVGWSFLSYIAQQAAAKGLKTLESIESRENHEAIAVERDMGFAVRDVPDDPSHVIVSRTLAVQ